MLFTVCVIISYIKFIVLILLSSSSTHDAHSLFEEFSEAAFRQQGPQCSNTAAISPTPQFGKLSALASGQQPCCGPAPDGHRRSHVVIVATARYVISTYVNHKQGLLSFHGMHQLSSYLSSFSEAVSLDIHKCVFHFDLNTKAHH